MTFTEELVGLLKHHEGLSLKPYTDTTGHLTIGYGRNLEEGISLAAAEFLLNEDVLMAFQELDRHKPWWRSLPHNAKLVVASMQFNLGWPTFKQFVKFWAALDHNQFHLAAQEMRNSLWAQQVKGRAEELACLMEEASAQRVTKLV